MSDNEKSRPEIEARLWAARLAKRAVMNLLLFVPLFILITFIPEIVDNLIKMAKNGEFSAVQAALSGVHIDPLYILLGLAVGSLVSIAISLAARR